MPKCQSPHKYKRITLARNKHPVYKCIRCPHFVIEPLVLGREAECWRCGNPFIMNEHSLLLKPHCGCKIRSYQTINLEKKSKGAALDEDKNKILEIKPKKVKTIHPELESAKSDIIAHLMSKLGSG